MKFKRYWLSCCKFTIAVSVNEQGVLVQAAPIAAKFVGQSATNLRKWMQRLGGFKWAPLP